MPESFDLGEAYDAALADGDSPEAVDVTEQSPGGEVVDASPEPGSPETISEGEPVDDAGLGSFAPSWFDEIDSALQYSGAPQAPLQPQMPPVGYDDYYNSPPPQAPPQAPQRDVRRDIDQLFSDPRSFIANAARSGLEPLQRQYAGQAQAELERIRHANTTNAMYNVRSALNKNYDEVLNKDNSFRGNDDVRGLVEGTLKTLSMQAANAAYTGNFAPTKVFENPKFYKAILAGARELAGFPSVSSDPAIPKGHAPSRVAPQQASRQRVQLPPDLEEVAKAVGSDAYRAELEEAYAEAQEHNDISWR